MTQELKLTQGKFALVDDEDFETVSKFKWNAYSHGNTWYAKRHIKTHNGRRTLRLHTFLTGYSRTDHIDGNGLNNQKANLREATPSQNMGNRKMQKNNTSKYKGVSWRKDLNKWHTKIGVEGKRVHLGYFIDEIAAAKAYDQAALKYFGEYAKTNEMLGILK